MGGRHPCSSYCYIFANKPSSVRYFGCFMQFDTAELESAVRFSKFDFLHYEKHVTYICNRSIYFICLFIIFLLFILLFQCLISIRLHCLLNGSTSIFISSDP